MIVLKQAQIIMTPKRGTFLNEVLLAVKKVPRGKVATYKSIGKSLWQYFKKQRRKFWKIMRNKWKIYLNNLSAFASADAGALVDKKATVDKKN